MVDGAGDIEEVAVGVLHAQFSLIARLRLEDLRRVLGVEALALGVDVDQLRGVVFAERLEEVGIGAVDGELLNRQVDEPSAIGESRVVDSNKGIGALKRPRVVRDGHVLQRALIPDIIVAPGQHHLEVIRELEDVLQVEGMHEELCGIGRLDTRSDVAHAVRVVRVDDGVEAGAVDAVGVVEPIVARRTGGAERVAYVADEGIAGEVFILHAATQAEASVGLQLVMVEVSLIGELQRSAQLEGVEGDVGACCLTASGTLEVVLINRIRRGEIRQRLGAEVVVHVVSESEGLVQSEGLGADVAVTERGVGAAVAEEVGLVVVARASIEAGQRLAFLQIKAAVGVIDVGTHGRREADVGAILIAIESATKLKTLSLIDVVSQG